MENVETPIKEQLTSKIRKIASNEEFRMEAFYFCGFPSGMPNEKLMNACKSYLEAADNAQPSGDITAKLISELEAAAAAPDLSIVNKPMIDNMADIQEVLDHRDLLLNP